MAGKTQRFYGWRPSPPDIRDHKFERAKGVRLASRYDLTSIQPPIYNQLQLGSCVGNGTARGFECARMREGLDVWTPSRLLIYFGARTIEKTVNQDSGATIRDGIKSVARWGACPESLWPYDITKFTNTPSPAAYAEAKKHLATKYESVDNTIVRDIQAALAQNKPIVFGATLYDSFEGDKVAKTGIVPMPGKMEDPVGGHCMTVVGIDLVARTIKVANSWGEEWGQKGYCQFPLAYLTNPNLSNDWWVVDMVT